MHHHDNHKNGKENNRKWYLRILSWIEWSEDSRYTDILCNAFYGLSLPLIRFDILCTTFYTVRLASVSYEFLIRSFSLSLSLLLSFISFALCRHTLPLYVSHIFVYTRAYFTLYIVCITAHIYSSSCVMSGVLLDRMVVNFRSLHYIYICMPHSQYGGRSSNISSS